MENFLFAARLTPNKASSRNYKCAHPSLMLVIAMRCSRIPYAKCVRHKARGKMGALYAEGHRANRPVLLYPRGKLRWNRTEAVSDRPGGLRRADRRERRFTRNRIHFRGH